MNLNKYVRTFAATLTIGWVSSACGLGFLSDLDVDACEAACEVHLACGTSEYAGTNSCRDACKTEEVGALVLRDDCVALINERNDCIAAAGTCDFEARCELDQDEVLRDCFNLDDT